MRKIRHRKRKFTFGMCNLQRKVKNVRGAFKKKLTSTKGNSGNGIAKSEYINIAKKKLGIMAIGETQQGQTL